MEIGSNPDIELSVQGNDQLGFSKKDAYRAGMSTANHLPGDLCFVCEEHILSFHFRYHVRMLLHSLTMNVLAVNGFIDFDEIGC